MMENKTNKCCYTLRTPVHVGSGEKLGKIDFVSDKNRCIVIDIDSLLLEIRDNSSAINEFSDGDVRIADFLKRHRISLASIQKYSIHNPDKIDPARSPIQEIIKTGMGNPFIPGSSIKGAIRTVILWHLVSATGEKIISDLLDGIIKSNVKKEQADEDIDKHFFGDDPNHDFLRGLQVGDVEFKLPDLRLVESKILNLDNQTSSGWKKMGKNGFTSADPKKATSIFSEALNDGAVSTGRIKIDDFLFDDPVCLKELDFSDTKKGLLSGLPEKCNQFARDFIESEIKFYAKCKMEDMVKFYTDLQSEIPEDNKFFLLHLGWGSGWRGMTGNWIGEKSLVRFRERFELGKLICPICPKCGKKTKPNKHKKGYSSCFECKKSFSTKLFPVFPKTRKIAFNNGNPAYPFGWIKVEKIQPEEAAAKVSQKALESEPVIQSEFIANYEKFRLRPSPDNFKNFIEKIKPEESDELKELSFIKMKGVINIGFVMPLIECETSEDIKQIIAGKLLRLIKKGKKWNSEKNDKYRQVENMASKT